MLRVGLFIAGLAVAFGAAFAVGRALDLDVSAGDADHARQASAVHDGGAQRKASASDEMRLAIADRSFAPGVRATLAFRVLDGEGRTVRDFDVEHERAMHLLSARRDLTGYRHLHPRQTGDGGWTVDVVFPEAGPRRVFADFVVDGEPQTLAADVVVAGDYAPRPLTAPARTADAGAGYVVTATANGTERSYTVARDGVPVEDLEPYLGARGHLVALRAGDLAFQHVHPRDAATVGRAIAFDVELTGDRPHRLFLQFKHDGAVRTAAFTEPGTGAGDDHGEAGHGH